MLTAATAIRCGLGPRGTNAPELMHSSHSAAPEIPTLTASTATSQPPALKALTASGVRQATMQARAGTATATVRTRSWWRWRAAANFSTTGPRPRTSHGAPATTSPGAHQRQDHELERFGPVVAVRADRQGGHYDHDASSEPQGRQRPPGPGRRRGELSALAVPYEEPQDQCYAEGAQGYGESHDLGIDIGVRNEHSYSSHDVEEDPE